MKLLQKVLCVLLVFLCIHVGANATDRPSKTVLVAVDLSESTIEHRKDYLKYFRVILDTMGEGDKLLVVTIAERPSVGETLAMEAMEYGTTSMTTNSRKVKDANLLGSITAVEKFEKLLTHDVKETPIIDVVQSIQRLLDLHKSERQVIVFMSDMMEYSKSTANFENSKPSFNQKSAEDAFSKIKREGRVANLKNVIVYVAGARELKKDKDNAVVAGARLAAVKWFWTSYFKESGAILAPNAYAPDLLKFDEIECNQTGKCSKGIFVLERDKLIRMPGK